MTKRLILFACWCLLLIVLALVTSYFAWTPFADGKRASTSGFYGPSHK